MDSRFRSAVRRCGGLLLAFAAAAALAGCSRLEMSSTPPDDISPATLRQWFTPLPQTAPSLNPQQEVQVALGRQVYFDSRLSRYHNESCNTCHRLSNYGTDNSQYSPGSVPGVWDTPRNTPTSYNAGFQFAQFWDGRADNLQSQAGGPMLAAHEMDLSSHQVAVDLVQTVPVYVQELHQAFPGQPNPVNIRNITEAISMFEQGLITPSPWDRYLRGDTSALNTRQKSGLRIFLRYGCDTCHAGRDMGGISFQRVGDVYPWTNKSDPGRAGVTHSPAEYLYFKVPTLRNVTMTGPWFQNGSVTRLTDAIRLMATMQSGQPMSRHDAQLVADFLSSTKGSLPSSYIATPAIPPTSSELAAENKAAHGGRL